MRITLEILDGPDYRVDENGWEHYRYALRLHYSSRTMDVDWHTGIANTDDPTVEDVLDNIIGSLRTFENGDTFEDFCGDYGYDTDSRKAEQTYRAVRREGRALRRLLGANRARIIMAESDHERAVASLV